MRAGRDVWWDEFVKGADAYCAPEKMDAEDMLYLLYTSGSTGKPKGIQHATRGYLTGAYATTKWVFDLKDTDVYWCTADIGWVTGHSYVVYGPLANGTTTVMYEGTPDTPDKDRFWRIIEKHGITICYTAPTAIRTFMRWGEEYPKRCDLSSLRLLGSVGEPINPEAWVWYWKVIGGGRCPVVDTWGQTETGHILITRRRPPPGRGTVVADRARAPPPPAAARGDHPQAGLGNQAFPWHRGSGRQRQGRAGQGGLPRDQEAMARHAPWYLSRPPALPGAVLEPLSGDLFHGRRRQDGRGRLLLAPRSGGRRHERLGPPRLHHGGGVRARRPSAGGGGGGHRPPTRDQGTGHRGLRHHQGRHHRLEGPHGGAQGTRGQEDRCACPA